MLTIWKFPLKLDDRQTVCVPAGSRVLSAKDQGGTICLWALVDDNAVTVDASVWIHGTGHPVKEAATDGRFVDSVIIHGGAIVLHVFVERGF